MKIVHKALGWFLGITVAFIPLSYVYHVIREVQVSWGIYQVEAHSVDDYLSFHLQVPKNFSVSLEQQDYKHTRAQEICRMATDSGIGQYCHELIAHLSRECGSMTEYCDWTLGKASNDHGWAIGLAQWHIWYRYHDWAVQNHFTYTYKPAKVAAMRDKFFQDFPEMRDWRGQARKYIAEMAGCTSDGYSIWHCIDTWNANPAYLSQVRGQLKLASKLLSPL